MTDINSVKKSYNQNAEYYHEGLKDKKNIWHSYVEKPIMIRILKKDIKEKKVLDLGCGSGIFTKKILGLGAEKVEGLDLSRELINIAQKENSKIKFYVGDAKRTPFKKNEFDVINSSLMVHYFKDLNPLFKEISRILKLQGIFVFSMHHPVFEVVHRVKIGNKKIREFQNYFHNNKYEFNLRDKIKLISYHHTFEMIFDSLRKSGFVIEELCEPKAPKSVEKLNKEIYVRSNQRPSFLIIKARKIK